MRRRHLPAGGLAGLASLFWFAPLVGQHPIEGSEWSVEMIRPTGQLVAPVFEGHYPNPDGTHSLVFGYHNLNTEESDVLRAGRVRSACCGERYSPQAEGAAGC